ncbi:MAG: helix-turn-helix domain-containing protein [Planctomycetes bacterium]|nr:helix-turn-helix domain-containing protein [Planctomycetota bacterium]
MSSQQAYSDEGEDQEFVVRLGALVKEYQLRGLARKLDIKHQKIIRYMKGAQPSVAFCRRIVKRLGVNPSWLLTGEGSPKLSDVPKAVASNASDLLELVQAMSAVSKMRLGALAGKQHLKVMRELNDAMVGYDKLRKRLNAHSQESFRQIIDMLHTSVHGNPDLGKAGQLVKAGEQVMRLCDDTGLRRAFLREAAMYDLFSGNLAATEHNLREVVLAAFVSCKDGLDDQACIDTHNLVGGLRQQLRLAEATRVTEAAIALTAPAFRKSVRFHFLLEMAGANDIDNGRLKRGHARILRALPRLPRDKQEVSSIPRLAGANFFAGAMNFQEAKAYCGKWGPLWVCSMALWSEDPKELREAESIAGNWHGAPNYFLLLLGKYAECAGIVRCRGGTHDNSRRLCGGESLPYASGANAHRISVRRQKVSDPPLSPHRPLFGEYCPCHCAACPFCRNAPPERSCSCCREQHS